MSDSGRQIGDQHDPKWQLEKTYTKVHTGYAVWSNDSTFEFPPTEQGRADAMRKLDELNKGSKP